MCGPIWAVEVWLLASSGGREEPGNVFLYFSTDSLLILNREETISLLLIPPSPLNSILFAPSKTPADQCARNR